MTPEERHREALADLDRQVLRRQQLVGAMRLPDVVEMQRRELRGAEGRKRILQRHQPSFHFHLGIYVCEADHLEDVPWEDCPECRDAAAGLDADESAPTEAGARKVPTPSTGIGSAPTPSVSARDAAAGLETTDG